MAINQLLVITNYKLVSYWLVITNYKSNNELNPGYGWSLAWFWSDYAPTVLSRTECIGHIESILRITVFQELLTSPLDFNSVPKINGSQGL